MSFCSTGQILLKNKAHFFNFSSLEVIGEILKDLFVRA